MLLLLYGLYEPLTPGDRAFAINLDARAFSVLSEVRAYAVPYEMNEITPSDENRTYPIGQDTRTLAVKL